MVSTRTEKHLNKRQLSQSKETLNDFVIGNDTIADAVKIETLEPQTNGFADSFGTFTFGVISSSQDQVFEKNIVDKINKEVDYVVVAVENRLHDAILTAIDNVVISRVEMAVRSFTESSGRRPDCMVQLPDQRDFPWDTKNMPLMSACSRMDLNIDQDGNDETRTVKNFDDGDFPGLRPNYDRQGQTHHNYE